MFPRDNHIHDTLQNYIVTPFIQQNLINRPHHPTADWSWRLQQSLTLILKLQRAIRSGRQTHKSALDDPPAAQGPGDGRRERDGDGDPHGEQCLVAEKREPERAAARRHELHRPVAGLPLPLRLFLQDLAGSGRQGAVAGGRGGWGLAVNGDARGHAEPPEDGFDVDVVVDGDVEASDGGARDG